MPYSIRDWDQHFETADTRKLKRLGWLKVPVKLDGWGYAHLIDHKDGPAHFGCWVALLELAASCKPRGSLNRPTGEPMTLHDISRQTRIPMAVMEAAITRMAAIGWVEPPENLPVPPDVPGDCRDFFRPRVEESRGDKSRGELTSAGADALSPQTPALTMQRVWNENRGTLPACESLGGSRPRKLAAMVREAHGDEALLASTVAAFAKDPFIAKSRYGIDTLCADVHRAKWLDRGRNGYEPPGANGNGRLRGDE